MAFTSLFTLPHVVLNLYELFFPSAEKGRYKTTAIEFYGVFCFSIAAFFQRSSQYLALI